MNENTYFKVAEVVSRRGYPVRFKVEIYNYHKIRSKSLFIYSSKFYLIALKKAKIAYNFGLSECNRGNVYSYTSMFFSH